MSLIVYINGFLIDTEPGEDFAQTKQVNDIASMENRQSNRTQSVDLPDTANNRRALQHLAAVGNQSDVPYQKNEAYIFSTSGECFVYKGWAQITNKDGGGFKAVIYDGIIDLYKAIENQSLAALGLTELNHIKSLANVLASWDIASPYRYILADYGGKNIYATDNINIDYQVPSVNTKWLWDKLFEFHGRTYTGSIFATEDFTNHWMTFPKGVFSTLPEETIYECTDMEVPPNGSPLQDFPNTKKSIFINSEAPTTNTLESIVTDRHFYPGETGMYRIEISGDISPRRFIYNASTGIHFEAPTQVDLILAKNQPTVTNPDYLVPLMTLQANIGNAGSLTPDSFSVNTIIDLNDLDGFCLAFRNSNDAVNLLRIIEGDNPVAMTIKRVVAQDVAFDVALEQFSQRDFFKEMLHKFALTPFADKYSNNIHFLTLEERLTTAEVDDWSDKFVSVENESYTVGSYARQNVFAHAYNDKESDYNNGVVAINNVNLDDSKVVIASKIYSPERERITFLNRPTNTYKLWDKEPTSDGSIQYKALDKRFYFLKSITHTFPTTTIGSETLDETDTITSAPVESFYRMAFNDIVTDYYYPLDSILNRALVQQINMNLSQRDIINLDFTKLKYIDKTASYYILNKVNNYLPTNKTTKCEFIRVNLNRIVQTAPPVDPEEPETIGYCVTWNAYNQDNIKMGIDGEIDFTTQLAGRVINTGLSAGTITSYVINGVTEVCSIPMSFTLHKATFSTDTLPVVTDEVLTVMTVSVLVVCTNASEIELNDTFSALEIPEQTESNFNECY